MTVATSIDGGTAFETVDTGAGRKSVFEIISNTINAISTASEVSRQGSAAAYAALDFKSAKRSSKLEFHITGGKGASTINTTISEGKLTDVGLK